MKELTASFISLGCPKNQVDAEMMLANLQDSGFQIVSDYADNPDVVIINTCGFIDDAKKEAIENILEAAEEKQNGSVGAIVVTGCLAQRYQYDILDEIPEVDAVVGIGANERIAEICKKVIAGESGLSSFPPREEMPMNGARVLTTPEHWAYLKIADGCSNRCSYCCIPSIRGDFRSRRMEDILDEARQLAESGIKEMILVAQDTTRYGEDIYGMLKLPELLNELCKIEGIEWIRMLYCYPDRLTDELLETMSSQPKILHYIDLPLQHADGKILKAMNRTGDADTLKALIEKIRTYMPDVVLRTTFITGFPGEGEAEFETLENFVTEMKFDKLGCFAFSPQEGTPAYDMDHQVEESVKERRGEIIMEKQFRIAEKKNEDRLGETVRVLVDGYDDYTDCYYGRSYMDAPEIDTVIYFTSPNPYMQGDFADVMLLDIQDYDLIGKEV